MCTTKSCAELSSIIQERMDTAFEPCKDFYNYSCGAFDAAAAMGGRLCIEITHVLIKQPCGHCSVLCKHPSLCKHPPHMHRKKRTQTWALTGTAHVRTCAVRLPVRVHGGTTLELVPPWTRMGRLTVQTRTWAVPVGARVRMCFSCDVC